MTSQTPDEALHFRGKTLTPESPRPLHISEPSNIPVLQNQMDPSYNDTSAFEGLSGVKEVTSNVSSGVEDGPRISQQFSSNTSSLLGNRSGNLTSDWVGQENTGSFPRSNKEDGLQSKDETVISSPHSEILTNPFASPVPDAFLRDVAPEEQPITQPDSNPVLDRSIPPDLTQPNSDPSLVSFEQHQPQKGTEFNNVSPTQAGLSINDQRDMNSDNGATYFPENTVNYGALLDNIGSSSSTTPIATRTVTTPPPTEDTNLLPSTSESSLPYSSCLPPRPPPQEKPAIHPSYSPTDNIRSFHPTHNVASNAISQYDSSNFNQASGYAPVVAPNGLLPPPPATFQQSQSSNPQVAKTFDTILRNESHDDNLEDSQGETQDEAPWAPEVQKKYDEFLHDERVYVTEGLWDRFPVGSRLFVGNLPTERVTKRDLFHLFHKHGQLAQVSIKQAYGFIQFLHSNSCRKALQAEQGAILRGRKIRKHDIPECYIIVSNKLDLEISKPQRNTRNAAPTETARSAGNRRSRSPDYGRNREADRSSRPNSARHDRKQDFGRPPFSDFRDRDHHRSRGDYRTLRSPSPRGLRRDGYHSREQSFDRYERRERRRSRSPYRRSERYRSPNPRDRGYTSESDLPIPRRDPLNVPDVQIIVLENTDSFVYRVENAFRDRGLRCDVLMLSPRISLSAVVHRQIVEGVLAIVRISRPNQYSGKIPLQVFDRNGGTDNVRFKEYSELEVGVAAEVILHARNTQQATIPMRQVQPQMLPVAMPTQPVQNNLGQFGDQNNLPSSLPSTLDGQTLHSLLNALQQNRPPPAQQPHSPSSINPTNLAALLGNISQQNNPVPSIPNTYPQPIQGAPYGMALSNPSFTSQPNLASLVTKGFGGETQGQGQHQQQRQQQSQAYPQVHQIMDQLSKWRQ